MAQKLDSAEWASMLKRAYEQQRDKQVTGLVVTDGRDSPRGSLQRSGTDEEMRLVCLKKHRNVATAREYVAQIMLHIPSKVIMDMSRNGPVDVNKHRTQARQNIHLGCDGAIRLVKLNYPELEK